MIGREGFEIGHRHAGEDHPQSARLGCGVETGLRVGSVPCVENHDAAALHEIAEAAHGCVIGRGAGCDDRPVEQGIDGQFIAQEIDTNGIGGFE